jgi:Protein of unknown function (DUF1566)
MINPVGLERSGAMMLQKILRRSAVLMVVLIAIWVGSWVPLASAGTREVKPKAPVPETGQTQCWDTAGVEIPCDGTGQDGDIQAGVPWPIPRFTDLGNGAVRDNLTGLIWLQQANCFGQRLWAQALIAANTLATGLCDLTDGSVPGDWRLPNIRELYSLIDVGFHLPALSNAAGTAQCTATDCAFLDVRSDLYWSSTTHAGTMSQAWIAGLGSGSAIALGKDSQILVWPVRGGR